MYKCQRKGCGIKSKERNEFWTYLGKRYCNWLSHWPNPKTCYDLIVQETADKSKELNAKKNK